MTWPPIRHEEGGNLMSYPKEIIVASLSDHGWTCEYHEPDPDCTECRRAHTRTATEILRALRAAGWRLYRADDCTIGQIVSVRYDPPDQDIIHLRVPSQMWDSTAMEHRYALVPAEGTPR